MHFKGGELWTDGEDQCNQCHYHNRCALQDALVQGVVLMAQESFIAKACPTYTERRMRLV